MYTLIFHIFAQGCVKYNHLVARVTKQFLILMPVFLTDTFGHVPNSTENKTVAPEVLLVIAELLTGMEKLPSI